MKGFSIFICLLGCYLSLQAQFCEISGSITDSVSHEFLAYGNISVLNESDSVVSGCMSNEKGEFRIKYLSCEQQYHLIVNYTGYVSKRIDLPEKLGSKHNTGIIGLSRSAAELEEAVVEGSTRYVEQKFDRKVYTMNEAKVSAAKNIFDLLRTLPGVTVDEAGNVKYKGAGATIYIDDMPSQYIYPKIEMIPVSLVIKIEVIDAALQSGSGKGGIINIKMKSMATDGLSGMAKVDAGTTTFTDFKYGSGFANLNYKTGALLFFANINYHNEASWSKSEAEGTLQFENAEFGKQWEQNFTSKRKNLWTYGGLRYSPSQNTRMFLSTGFYQQQNNYVSNGENITNFNNGTAIFDQYSVESTMSQPFMNKWINIYFYHCFDTVGRELSVYAGIQDQKYNSSSNEIYHYTASNGSETNNSVTYTSAQDSYSTGMWAGAYYNHPFNALTRWNIGYRGWFPLRDYSSDTFFINGLTYLPNSGNTHAISPSQSIYSRFGTTLKKWKLDFGLSADHDQSHVDYVRYTELSIDTTFSLNKAYLNLLPSSTIVFSADSINDIKLTYSRSVQTPYHTQLCDFTDKQDPHNWNVGNSHLQPVVYHNLYLGYSMNHNTWNFSADAFFSLTNNDVAYLSIPLTETIYLSMPQNVNRKSSYGLDISAYYNLKGKVDLNFSSSLYHTILNGENLNENLIKKDFGYNIKLSSDIRFSKKSSANIYVNYFSREISIEGYIFGYFDSSVSFTQRFLGNSLLCTAGVNGMFNDLVKHGNFHDYGGFIYTSYNNGSEYKPTFFFSIQYNFRQGDRGTQNAGKM